MCLSDLQLGQYVKSAAHVHTTNSGASKVILGPNRNRVGIQFYRTASKEVTILPIIEPDSAGRGFKVGDAQTIQKFTIQTDGDLPQQRWYSFCSSSLKIVVIEFIVPTEVMQRIFPDVGLPMS